MNRKMQVAILLGATIINSPVLAKNIDEIIVYSAPFQKSVNDVISTTEIIDRSALGTSVNLPIGEVLSDLPGVSSAGFGPAVGQPIIRGLGGYRIDTMQNGMSVGDIAPTGGDHANALSLFDATRIEVLKGPAALRYGAFAGTGVVNSFNRHMESDGEDAGDVLFGLGDNADETTIAVFARRDGFAISAFSQDADNITIPTHAESDRQLAAEGETDEDVEQTAEHTENESSGFTVSGHFGDDATTLSLMLQSQEKDYGVPGHSHGDADGASIELEQQSLHARLSQKAIGPFRNLQTDLTLTDFEQTEFEGAEVGTEFEQDSFNLRSEATFEFKSWQTLLGAEYRSNELESISEEHEDEDEGDDDDEHHGFYLPNSERTQFGVFAFAARENNNWLTELAARFDTIEQKSRHAEEPDENADISHDLINLSAGLARRLNEGLLVGASLSAIQRAPSQVELFAEGEHAAARRHEEGDIGLDKEEAFASEIYLRQQWQNSSLRVALFNNDYSDFIYMARDPDEDEEDEGILGFAYEQQDAEISGLEVEYLTGFALGGHALDVGLSYSSLDGELANGGNLPALPPQKIGVSLATDFGAAQVKLNIQNIDDQTDTAADELATDGYTSIDLSLDWQPAAYEGLNITAAIRNASDEEIRQHTSPLKDLVPEAGQDIRISARYKF